jgi:ribosomal protein S18 acetylase RimI-like enzyme
VGSERRWAWRFATFGDVPALVELARLAYRGGRGWTSEAALVEGQRTDLEAMLVVLERSLVLVVEHESKLIACCRLDPRPDGVAHFGMFAVDPDHQSDGLGGWLLAQAERVAVERLGAGVVELNVLLQQTALVDWYERLGFVQAGEPKPFPAHPRFARPTREGLQFAVYRKTVS